MFHGATYAGIVPRFNFDARLGITTDIDGAVVKWADQGRYKYDVVQSNVTPHNLPVFNPTSTNGLPGVTFTPALNTCGLENRNAPDLYQQNDARTIIAVVRPAGVSPIAAGVLGGTVMTFRLSTHVFACYLITFGSPGSPTQFCYSDGVSTNIQMTTPVDYSHTPLLARWQASATTMDFFVNGVQIATGTNTLGLETGVQPNFQLGNIVTTDGGQAFNGDINQIVCLDGIPTEEISVVEAKLTADWGPF